jgi:hypothetical protein
MARTRALLKTIRAFLKNPDDDPLTDPDKAFDALEEGRYRAELELVDRYQSFTAELLRLSLLGIAVFGFLYKITFEAEANIGVAKVPAAVGVLAFGISALGALIFRFFAAEGARFYIEALRFITPANADRAQKERAKESLDTRYRKVLICRWSKGIAAAALASGGVFEAVAFFLLLI